MNLLTSQVVPIDFCVNLFMGYMQNNGSPGSGFVQTEALAHQICCGLPNVRVNLFPWDVDEESVAEWLWRYRPENRPQVHLVGSYSYGSDRAVKFMNALLKRSDPNEVQVRCWGSCDGVKRWDLVPGIAGATGLGKLHVPVNVEDVFWYRQLNPRWGFRKSVFEPAGHDIVDSPERHRFTKNYAELVDAAPDVWHPRPIPKPVIRQSHHSYIDNDLSFRQTFLAKVLDMAEDAKALWDKEKYRYDI